MIEFLHNYSLYFILVPALALLGLLVAPAFERKIYLAALAFLGCFLGAVGPAEVLKNYHLPKGTCAEYPEIKTLVFLTQDVIAALSRKLERTKSPAVRAKIEREIYQMKRLLVLEKAKEKGVSEFMILDRVKNKYAIIDPSGQIHKNFELKALQSPQIRFKPCSPELISAARLIK